MCYVCVRVCVSGLVSKEEFDAYAECNIDDEEKEVCGCVVLS